MSKKSPPRKSDCPDEPDFEMVTDEGKSDDEYFTDSNAEDSDGNKKPERIRMYCRYTKYDAVKEAAKNYNEFKLTKKWKTDWDIAWFDGPIGVKILKDMNYNQRINHYPGIYNLARKNMLGRHLKKMKSLLPTHYNFFPRTYMLPLEYKDFREDSLCAKANPVYILKPENSCQGQGIFLTRNWESVSPKEQMVAQRYLQKPHLIDGLKYDLRLYVFINGINPLRIYLYKDGLARFATSKYQKPSERNLDNLFMHLTNYAVNKEAENYVEASGPSSEAVASKRSYQHVLKLIEDKYGREKRLELEAGIADVLIKSVCMVQPHVRHLVRSSQPDDLENQLCFQILGFDIMIDHNLRPFLIEINQMPSFATDSWLDQKVKRGLLVDCMKCLCLSMKRKRKYQKEKRARMTERLMVKPAHTVKARAEKGDPERGSEFQKIEQQGAAEQCTIARAEEERRNKALAKRQAQEEKERERRVHMIRREVEEAKACNGLQLIFPILSYQEQFKIEDLYEHHEKQLKARIETAKKIAAEIAKAEKRKSDFDVQQDVYDKITKGQPLRDSLFELEVNTVGPKEEDSEEAKAEKLFKNHVYELVFQDIASRRQGSSREQDQILDEYRKERAIRRRQKLQEKRRKMAALKRKQAEQEKQRRAQRALNSDESDDDEEEQELKRSDDGYGEEEEEEEIAIDASSEEEPQFQAVGMRDLREAYLQQRTYEKFMVAAANLWDQFTSGKAVERVKKMREQEELEEKTRREEQKRRAEEKLRNQRRLRQQMKERGLKEEELYKLFRTEMEEEEAEKEAEREKARKAPIRKANTENDTHFSFSYMRRGENRTGSTKDEADYLESYSSGDESNSESGTHSTSRKQCSNQQTVRCQETMIDMASRNDQAEVQKQAGDEKAKKTRNKLPMLAAQNLTRAINKETANLLQYTQMTGLPAGHSAYSIQPTIKKLKNVDYYKLMKEKYVQKRAQLVQKKDAGMGQGLGAITILNGQRTTGEPSPAGLTVGSSYRLPRQGSTLAGRDTGANTAGDLSYDGPKISEYHREMEVPSGTESKGQRSAVIETPLAPLKAQSQEVSQASTIKGQFRTAGRQSMASSPPGRERMDDVSVAPTVAMHLHRTPNIRRNQNIHLVAGDSGVVPRFSTKHKTINTTKQFESQDESTPLLRANRVNHPQAMDSTYDEWQSKFDQPTSQLITTLYQDYNGSKRRTKSKSICAQIPPKQATVEPGVGAGKYQVAAGVQPRDHLVQRAGSNIKPPATVKQFKEKTICINIQDLEKKSIAQRKLSTGTAALHNYFYKETNAPQPHSPQPVAARMAAAPEQSPGFSYRRDLGISQGDRAGLASKMPHYLTTPPGPSTSGFPTPIDSSSTRGVCCLPSINSSSTQPSRVSDLQHITARKAQPSYPGASLADDGHAIDYQPSFHNPPQATKHGIQTHRVERALARAIGAEQRLLGLQATAAAAGQSHQRAAAEVACLGASQRRIGEGICAQRASISHI